MPALPERTIGPQISAVSGPLARTIGDLRIALAAMSGKDVRDPWWVPAPLEGPADAEARRAVSQPDGLETVAEVKAARRRCRQAAGARRLDGRGDRDHAAAARAGRAQTKLWLGDGYEAQLDAAEREGDPGALACLRGNRAKVFPFDAAAFSKTLTRRATLTREWLQFFETYAGAADAGIRRTAVSRRARPARRGLVRAGMAGATARKSPFPSWGCLG